MLEEEWKFEIRALRPEAEELMGRLRREKRLGKFSLGPCRQKDIEDSFFDTITRDLSAKRCMLRLRVEDATVVKLTLKRPMLAETEKGGLTRRYESEAEPSIELLEQIRSELTDLGIAGLEISSVDFRKAGPVGALLRWGFQEVLTALNQRGERAVYVEGQRIATLALDDVTFSTPEKQYKIREIEVERWEEAPLSLCAEFVSLLEQISAPGLLFPVSESKYERARNLIAREQDFNCEMKLIRTDLSLSAEEVEKRFLEMDHIASYTLENPPLTIFLSDVYYDTGELKLLRRDHYLRVRSVVTPGRDRSTPAIQELTLRRYVYTQPDEELRGSDQIKGPLSKENLAEVLRVLKSLGVIQLSDADILNAEASEHTLRRAGLQQVLDVDIERRLWHVFDSAERQFANIKLDKVRFQSPQYKSVSYWEIEIGALEISDLDKVRSMAYFLKDGLGLKPYNSPKYKTGHNLVRDLPLSTNGVLRFVVRTPTWADQWAAQVVVRQIAGQRSVQQTLEDMPLRERKELLERGTEGLKTTVEKTLDKLSSMRQMQMVMAGALFSFGLAIIGVSAYLAAVGTMSLEQSVVGTGGGVILDVLVLFPFRRMSSLSEQYIRLATLGEMVQIFLGMEVMSPEVRESVEILIQDALGGATLKAGGQGKEVGEGKDEKHSQR